MSVQTDESLDGGPLTAAISNAVVTIMRAYTGRGPSYARTTIRDNLVVVLLSDTLTAGERALVRSGRAENVLALRHEFHEAMRGECSAQVAELTGRRVLAMMSANNIEPDLAAELFVLEN